MTTRILFIQGAGAGAHAEDAPLAESLRQQLGPDHEVIFPRMPDEADPDVERWKQTIASELARMTGNVLLVGHSAGRSTLLKFLAEEGIEKPIGGLFLLAAPSWDEHDWNFDVLKLPPDMAAKLSGIPSLFLYHCRDDSIVPFEHLALHCARMPRAVARAFDTGGHQFGNDLACVASDIRGDDVA